MWLSIISRVMDSETSDPRNIFLAVRSHSSNTRISLPDPTSTTVWSQTCCHCESTRQLSKNSRFLSSLFLIIVTWALAVGMENPTMTGSDNSPRLPQFHSSGLWCSSLLIPTRVSAAVSCQVVLVTLTYVYLGLREKESQQTGKSPCTLSKTSQ